MEATSPQEQMSDFTNTYWGDFGKPDDQKKSILASMSADQKKARKDWLDEMHGTKMPTGPYPFYLRDYGWCQVTLPDDGPVWANYVQRGDQNLDVNFFTNTDDDATGGQKLKMVSQKTKIQHVQIYQEAYDPKENVFISKPIGPISLTGK